MCWELVYISHWFILVKKWPCNGNHYNFTWGWSKVHGCDLAQLSAICHARGLTPTSLGWRSSESYRNCSPRFVGRFHLPLQHLMPWSTLKGWTTVIFGWMRRWMRSSPTFTEIDMPRFHQIGRMPLRHDDFPMHFKFVAAWSPFPSLENFEVGAGFSQLLLEAFTQHFYRNYVILGKTLENRVLGHRQPVF